MARTSTRRWKGCQMCKPHKHAANPPANRQTFNDLRAVGQLRRISRRQVPPQEQW